MLKEALAVVDENRRLLRELFEYRKAEPTPRSRASKRSTLR
jgi:benzoyl-CoA reductase/2-hydroxyglutaryl-CoA dehydratase subunit BcrC/BadD/HgdB